MGSCDATSLMEDGTQKPLQNVSKGGVWQTLEESCWKGGHGSGENFVLASHVGKRRPRRVAMFFPREDFCIRIHCTVQLLPSLELLRGADTLDWRACDCTALLGPLAKVAVPWRRPPCSPKSYQGSAVQDQRGDAQLGHTAAGWQLFPPRRAQLLPDDNNCNSYKYSNTSTDTALASAVLLVSFILANSQL